MLAGSIILAHALVPHHQHNGEPFFGATECHHFHSHEHETAGHVSTCHHDHSEKDATDCVLHNLLVIPGKQIRADQPLAATILQQTFCALLVKQLFNPDLNTNAINWHYHIEGTIPLPASIYTSTQGLRAPPIV